MMFSWSWLHNENYNQVKPWSSQYCYEHNFSDCVEKPEKFRTSTGFKPCDLVMPVRCSNQLSYEATDVENWSFVGSDVPMMNESAKEMI